MPRFRTAVLPALFAVFVCSAAMAGRMAVAGSGDETVKASEAPGAVVATEQKPATFQVHGGGSKDGSALEVTARPVGGDASSPPYLVGVFVAPGAQSADRTPKLLGSFSFYPASPGEVQTFVLPKPKLDDASVGKDLTLSIKLIPANPARDIKDAAVEILGARVVD